MQVTVSHPTYGIITYDEGFWTGKKTILFDGIPLVKIKKNIFQLPADPTVEGSSPLTVTVKGSYIGGITLTVGDEVITLTQKAATSDYVLGILPGALFFAFIIASVSAYFGYTVEGGSIAVGKASTDSVVMSSVLILFSDLILTQLLMG
jgi:hypothetical protein